MLLMLTLFCSVWKALHWVQFRKTNDFRCFEWIPWCWFECSFLWFLGIFFATILIFKFYIQIIDVRIHFSSGWKHFLRILRIILLWSIIYVHKMAMNDNLHQNTANIQERNRYGSSVPECISTRFLRIIPISM